MERSKILEILRTGIREQFSLPANQELAEGALLREDLGADSLDDVEFVMFVEDAFNIPDCVPDEIAESWKTLSDIVNYLEQQECVKKQIS